MNLKKIRYVSAALSVTLILTSAGITACSKKDDPKDTEIEIKVTDKSRDSEMEGTQLTNEFTDTTTKETSDKTDKKDTTESSSDITEETEETTEPTETTTEATTVVANPQDVQVYFQTSEYYPDSRLAVIEVPGRELDKENSIKPKVLFMTSDHVDPDYFEKIKEPQEFVEGYFEEYEGGPYFNVSFRTGEMDEAGNPIWSDFVPMKLEGITFPTTEPAAYTTIDECVSYSFWHYISQKLLYMNIVIESDRIPDEEGIIHGYIYYIPNTTKQENGAFDPLKYDDPNELYVQLNEELIAKGFARLDPEYNGPYLENYKKYPQYYDDNYYGYPILCDLGTAQKVDGQPVYYYNTCVIYEPENEWFIWKVYDINRTDYVIEKMPEDGIIKYEN